MPHERVGDEQRTALEDVDQRGRAVGADQGGRRHRRGGQSPARGGDHVAGAGVRLLADEQLIAPALPLIAIDDLGHRIAVCELGHVAISNIASTCSSIPLCENVRMPSRRRYAQQGDACATAHAIELLGDRWTYPVIRELMLAPKRFGELESGLRGVTPAVLTARLRELEGAGLIRRATLPPPANVPVYELTDWARELEPTFAALGRWAHGSPTRTLEGAGLTPDAAVQSMTTMAPTEPIERADPAAAAPVRRARRWGGRVRLRAVVGCRGPAHRARVEPAVPRRAVRADSSEWALILHAGRAAGRLRRRDRRRPRTRWSDWWSCSRALGPRPPVVERRAQRGDETRRRPADRRVERVSSRGADPAVGPLGPYRRVAQRPGGSGQKIIGRSSSSRRDR